ncbi:MAG: hypothetical protein KAS69_06130 [Planctomycetes bacterium]|nr:hypothetical protein [Planctomycetota bacterium]
MNKRLLIVVVPLLILVGCAAESSNMVPATFEVTNRHPYSVSVSDSIGGRKTNPLWTSQISDYAYTQALNEALFQSCVFKLVMRGDGADYILNVTILRYDQPIIGLDFDVKMNTKWELFDGKTLKPVWSDTFKTTYRSRLSDALIAAERLKKANEGSARVNIAEGIKRLSMIKL